MRASDTTSVPFSIEEMRRPIEGDLLGARVFVASAEDTVISQLEWAKLGGGSELQLRDAAGIVTLHGTSKLDVAYIERWVRKLAWKNRGVDCLRRPVNRAINPRNAAVILASGNR